MNRMVNAAAVDRNTCIGQFLFVELNYERVNTQNHGVRMDYRTVTVRSCTGKEMLWFQTEMIANSIN